MAATLRDIEGLEYREIAEALDVPAGTVMSRILRAPAKNHLFLRGKIDMISA